MEFIRFWMMLLALPASLEALKILGVFPLAGKSHFIPCGKLMKGLARKGHQVDVISHFPLAKPIPNYTDFSIKDSIPFSHVNNMSYSETQAFIGFKMSNFVKVTGTDVCDLLSYGVLQQFLKVDKNIYDVVIVELFGAQCYLAFGQHLNATLVGIVVSKMHDWLYGSFGIPFNTAYIPSLFSSFDQQMTFTERFKNTLLSSIITPQVNYYMENQREHVEKYFNRRISSISELYEDISVLLVNSHHSLNGIVPMPPGVVEVGGIHVYDDDDNEQELSLNLKNWLDNSEHGFVYISFGSMLRIETFPPEMLKAFYDMFEEIAPVRVLMKIAKPEVLPEKLPKNVITSTWLPQVAVLSHKNIRLFITHGGLMGTQESVAHGVPMIGIPVFGDQHTNIHMYEKKKVAIGLKLEEITSKTLIKAVKTILHDSNYRNNAKTLSEIFHDRPLNALDTAIYWVEYAARHGKLLQSPAAKLSWVQYYLIDVYGSVLLAILLLLYMIKKAAILLYRMLCRKPKTNISKKMK